MGKLAAAKGGKGLFEKVREGVLYMWHAHMATRGYRRGGAGDIFLVGILFFFTLDFRYTAGLGFRQGGAGEGGDRRYLSFRNLFFFSFLFPAFYEITAQSLKPVCILSHRQ